MPKWDGLLILILKSLFSGVVILVGGVLLTLVIYNINVSTFHTFLAIFHLNALLVNRFICMHTMIMYNTDSKVVKNGRISMVSKLQSCFLGCWLSKTSALFQPVPCMNEK